MRDVRVWLGAVVVWGALVASAAAQDACTEGRVINEGTAGRCCWPGQTWNEEHGRCAGAPTCPEELVAHGDSCVGRVEECVDAEPPAEWSGATSQLGGPQTPGAEPRPPPPTGNVSSTSYAHFGRERPIARQVETDITGLYVAGFITFGIAHAFALVMGSFAFTACCGDSHGWVTWIPVVGGFIQPAVDESNWSGEWFGIPSSIVQIGGVVMILVGMLTKRTVTVTSYENEERAGLRMTNGPGELGMGLAWDF